MADVSIQQPEHPVDQAVDSAVAQEDNSNTAPDASISETTTIPEVPELEAGVEQDHGESLSTRLKKYTITELKSLLRWQWLLTACLACVVVPWTYRSYRLAAWTANLEYVRECRVEMVCTKKQSSGIAKNKG